MYVLYKWGWLYIWVGCGGIKLLLCSSHLLSVVSTYYLSSRPDCRRLAVFVFRVLKCPMPFWVKMAGALSAFLRSPHPPSRAGSAWGSWASSLGRRRAGPPPSCPPFLGLCTLPPASYSQLPALCGDGRVGGLGHAVGGGFAPRGDWGPRRARARLRP